MNTSDFNFSLPKELIASEPAVPRDSCRMIVVNRNNAEISHAKFYDIIDYLKAGDVLVLNNSRVIPARINFIFNGSIFELLLIRSISGSDWKCIGKPGKKLLKGLFFKINENVSFEILEKHLDGEMLVRFSVISGKLEDQLKSAGAPPFPPYIKNSRASFDDYQTVYATADGSVAAPTAGLHFTRELLDCLNKKGVKINYVTLHVGLGTFLPIKSEIIEQHRMHREVYEIDDDTARSLTESIQNGKRIIAVGTTSVRVLESAINEKSAFKSGYGETDIFIYPGYKWKCVNGLITNFHLPKSTLLLLVSSFGGKELVFKAYREAIRLKYRFYSFGDAMLIV